MLALNQKQLLDEVELLPIDIKTKIVDKILSSLNPTDKTITDLWIKEAKERKNQIELNQTELINGDEVFRKIAKKLKLKTPLSSVQTKSFNLNEKKTLEETKIHQDWQPKLPKHKIKIDDTHYRQPHPVWDLQDSEIVEQTHYKPRGLKDKYALYTIRFLRWAFDRVTFYDKEKMTENKYLTRAIFLETIAAVPGMVAGMHRHMKALRTLKPDGGWIHHLLEEAENERMHLLTFLQIKQPGILLRLGILASQFLFTFYYSFHYI